MIAPPPHCIHDSTDTSSLPSSPEAQPPSVLPLFCASAVIPSEDSTQGGACAAAALEQCGLHLFVSSGDSSHLQRALRPPEPPDLMHDGMHDASSRDPSPTNSTGPSEGDAASATSELRGSTTSDTPLAPLSISPHSSIGADDHPSAIDTDSSQLMSAPSSASPLPDDPLAAMAATITAAAIDEAMGRVGCDVPPLPPARGCSLCERVEGAVAHAPWEAPFGGALPLVPTLETDEMGICNDSSSGEMTDPAPAVAPPPPLAVADAVADGTHELGDGLVISEGCSSGSLSGGRVNPPSSVPSSSREGDKKPWKKPRGKRLRNELADSSGFSVQWRQPTGFVNADEKAASVDAGSAARALGLSMLQRSDVRGVTRRASRVAGEACVAAELNSSGTLAIADAAAAAMPSGGVVDGGAGGASDRSVASSGVPQWSCAGGVAAPGIMSPSKLGQVDVGALASGLLQKLQSDETKVDVPVGGMHQVDALPEYAGPLTAGSTGDAGEHDDEPSTPQLTLRHLEIEWAQTTAARLTAAAYGSHTEVASRYCPCDDDNGPWNSTASPHAPLRSGSAYPVDGYHPARLAGGDEFACPDCGKVLCRQGALTMHMRYCKVRHGRSEDPPADAPSAAPPASPPAEASSSTAAPAAVHTCSICQRTFGNAGSLARHFNACARDAAEADEAVAVAEVEVKAEAEVEVKAEAKAEANAEAKAEPAPHAPPEPPEPPAEPSSPKRALSGVGTKRRRSKAERAVEDELMKQPDVFVVEKLLAERYHGSGARRHKQYLVAWEGYGREEDTWEAADSILDVRRNRHAMATPRLAPLGSPPVGLAFIGV